MPVVVEPMYVPTCCYTIMYLIMKLSVPSQGYILRTSAGCLDRA